ncbi:MAG: ribbon-helix-helix domain-containing protein [Acidobacteriota bacterium]|nr:ribbon-helix-helix domain-containing protein [Acidobacteriota bacterium]
MSSTERHTRRLSITLTREQYRELERVARHKRVSRAWVVRDAVDQYLEAQMPLFSSRTISSSDSGE